jgi:hypothetical protein
VTGHCSFDLQFDLDSIWTFIFGVPASSGTVVSSIHNVCTESAFLLLGMLRSMLNSVSCGGREGLRALARDAGCWGCACHAFGLTDKACWYLLWPPTSLSRQPPPCLLSSGVRMDSKTTGSQALVVHAFNPSRGRRISEFEASLVYRVSSDNQGYTEKPCLEKPK